MITKKISIIDWRRAIQSSMLKVSVVDIFRGKNY